MIRRVWVWLAMLLVPATMRAQVLGGAWVATNGACVEFHPTSNAMMLDPLSWYEGWRKGGQRFEYVRRKDLLIIKHFHNQVLPFWYEKEQCVFKIDTLTQAVLRLTLLSDGDKEGGAILESIGGENVVLNRVHVGCLSQMGIPLDR